MILAALALAAATPVKGPEIFYGFPDQDSCGYWIQERRKGANGSQLWEGWILGFITGLNVFGTNNGNVAPDVKAEGLQAWVDQYCADHPLDSISVAAVKLAEALKQRHAG
jgi:hypothetical protein